MNIVEVVVPAELDGQRADKILSILLESSRSAARSIFDTGDAVANGVPLRPAEKLNAGTVICVELPAVDVEIQPEEDVPFAVVHVDSDLIVVDKPAGVVVHPGSGRSTGTLVNGLMARFPDIVGVGQEKRWGIVHRLDRDTSGLLVVARTDAAYERLIEMMKSREVSRRYLSVVQGLFTNTIGTIEAPVGRDPQNPTRMHVTRAGKPARTHYRRLADWPSKDASLLSVTLDSGRTHQIRVHLRSIGHQIIGDGVYGRRGVGGDPGRPWLHARELAFRHPITSDELRFISGLPDDLSDSLVSLGEPETGVITDLNGELL
jgi:23S rRNA pseudouridine1911/1915/1917 synthase